MTGQPKHITIDAPSEMTILAARHLDPAEGPAQVGNVIDTATRSAITTVLRYVAKAHNIPQTAPAEQTEARLAHQQTTSEAAGRLLTRTTDERDQLRAANDRVTALYEQWVKAGPPPLGASMARWWDARLAELHAALLNTTKEN